LDTSEVNNFSKKVEIFNENYNDKEKKEINPVNDPFRSKIFRLDSTDLVEKSESKPRPQKYATVYKCCCGRHPTSYLTEKSEQKEQTEQSFYDKLQHSYTCTCGWCNLTPKEEKEQEDAELHEYCIKYCCCGGKCKPSEGRKFLFK